MLRLIRRHRTSLSRRRRHVSSQLPKYVAASVEIHRRILRQAYRHPATSIAAFYGKCEFGPVMQMQGIASFEKKDLDRYQDRVDVITDVKDNIFYIFIS
jgi:hypothetical protein